MSRASAAARFQTAADGKSAAAIVIAAVLVLAIANAFVTDDAFISFRYARNLVEARELAWNPGTDERVEGYTNFLWTLMMAGAIAIGLDPPFVSQVLGILFAFGTLLLAYRLSARVLQSGRAALLAVLLLGTNYTFVAFATSGLETQMQAFLILAGASLAFSIVEEGRRSARRAAVFSACCAAALLTRLDSAIPVAVLYLYLFMKPAAPERGQGNRAAAWAALVLPALLAVGSWLVWKRGYYGAVLPNSYHAKGPALSLDILKGGVLYLFEFFRAYGLLSVAFLLLFMCRSVLARREMRILACIGALWFVYIVAVGGDFMEFRFLVPVLPLLCLPAAATLRALPGRVQAALVTMLLFCSIYHAAAFKGTPGVEPVWKLREYVAGENGNWELAGKALAELFPDGDVTIATTAAGAIPYYSKLPAVDMLGINDAWVARSGDIIGPRAGHRRAATLAYLVERRVNLVIGHPILEPIDAGFDPGVYSVENLKERFMIQHVDAGLVPIDAEILSIPLDARHRLTVLYLVRDARVDAALREKGVARFPVARS